MTTSTDDNRLGILEGRLIELSAAVQELRADSRELSARVDARVQQVNSRIDRLFLAMLGIGAAQITLLITLIFRSG